MWVEEVQQKCRNHFQLHRPGNTVETPGEEVQYSMCGLMRKPQHSYTWCEKRLLLQKHSYRSSRAGVWCFFVEYMKSKLQLYLTCGDTQVKVHQKLLFITKSNPDIWCVHWLTPNERKSSLWIKKNLYPHKCSYHICKILLGSFFFFFRILWWHHITDVYHIWV